MGRNSLYKQWTIRPSTFDVGSRGKKRAVFIGMSYKKCTDPIIKKIKNSTKDANLAEEYLKKKLNWIPDEIRRLSDDEDDLNNKNKTYEYSSRNNIIDSIQWLIDGSVEGDVLFLHISGHGVKLSEKREGLVPADCENLYCENLSVENSNIKKLSIEESSIADKVFFDALISKVPKKVTLYVIFDTCYSGKILKLPYVWNDMQHMRKQKTKKIKGTIIMLSGCHANEIAYDDKSFSLILYKNLHKKISWFDYLKLFRSKLIDQTPQIETSKKIKMMSGIAFHRMRTQNNNISKCFPFFI